MILNMLSTIFFTMVTLISSIAGAGAHATDMSREQGLRAFLQRTENSVRAAVSSVPGVDALAPGLAAGSEEWDISSYLKRAEWRAKLPNKLSFGLLPENRFELEFDEKMGKMFADMKALTGYDAMAVASSWPDMYYSSRWLYTLFPGIFNNTRDYILDKADEYESSDWNRMALYRVLGPAAGMPTKVKVFAKENYHGKGLHECCLEFTFADGSVRQIETKATYNEKEGYVYHDGDAWQGIAGLGYNMNLKDGWAYTSFSSWQRSLGYMKLYDNMLLKTSDMVYVDTERLKFSYAGKDWMIQLWKGRYFITTGGELGIYNKPKDRWIEFYDADNDNYVHMSYRIRLKETGELLVNRPLTWHWWMTGFSVRPQVYGPSQIALETEIVPRDAEMEAAIKGALDKEISKGAPLTYKMINVSQKTYGYGKAFAIVY